jgi:hypothetical protein
VIVRLIVVALVAVLFAGGGGWRRDAGAVAAPEPQPSAPGSSHQDADIDCLNCHRGNHQGVIQMYIGKGGRGAPAIPSHMFQVCVDCVACHTAPKTDGATPAFVGQTYRPSEQACVTCHGEKYRGMIRRWSETLARMRGILDPKLDTARAALAGAALKKPELERARKLVDDAAFNMKFVALGKGVHNVFYAADLLKVGNGWLDEAVTLLGTPPVKSDDTLVRGGYCAVLCHEAAGVKPKTVATFGKQRLPHERHVTEFGATCTSCHSSETHKAVTATAATCTSCHHSPKNERCESCHRAQADFYRGQGPTTLVKVAPNVMADAVGCTGCHDFSRKHSREAVGRACITCHEPPYTALLTEWTRGFDAELRSATTAVRGAEQALARARRAGGKAMPEAAALLNEARQALGLVRVARPAHNPLAADALLAKVRANADSVGRLASPPAATR